MTLDQAVAEFGLAALPPSGTRSKPLISHETPQRKLRSLPLRYRRSAATFPLEILTLAWPTSS